MALVVRARDVTVILMMTHHKDQTTVDNKKLQVAYKLLRQWSGIIKDMWWAEKKRMF